MLCFNPLRRTSAQVMRKIKYRCPVLPYWAVEKLVSQSAASVWGWCLNRELGLELYQTWTELQYRLGKVLHREQTASSFFCIMEHRQQRVRPWRGQLGVCNTINLHLDSARYFNLCQFSPLVEFSQIQTPFLRSRHGLSSWFMSHEGRTDKESKWK